jgi:hypothetical protein
MKVSSKLLTTAAVFTTAATLLIAQDNRPPRDGQRPSGGQGGSGQRPGGQNQGGQGSGGQQGGGMQRPHMPLIEALDANKNHVIDADEIANASAALKKLDKNGDGKLTPDEFMGPRPGGDGSHNGGDAGGPPGGQNNSQQRQRPKSE